MVSLLCLLALGPTTAVDARPPASLLAVGLEAREPPRHPGAAAVPEIGRIAEPGLPELILRGRLPAGRAQALVRVVRALVADFRRRLAPQAAGAVRPPVDVCLFADLAAYRAFLTEVFGPDTTEGNLGLYSPYRRLVIINLATGLGNLRHEVVHALADEEFGALPAWLHEGLASLYNSVEEEPEGLRLLPDHRLAQLRAARAAGRLPDLAALAEATGRQVYDDERYADYYAVSRFLLLYLDGRGTLRDFLAALRAAPITAAHQREVLGRFVDWKAFLAWTDELKT